MSDSAALGVFDAAFLRALERLAFRLRRERAAVGAGTVRRERRGGRVEFADHRPYAPGDDPRHVDWAAYARTGRFYVKEFEREEDLAVLVCVDASASMALHGKARAALRLGYALAYLAVAAGSRARVAALRAGDVELSATVSATPRLPDLARFLSAVAFAGTTDLDGSLARIPVAARGARVLVVVSDLIAARDGRAALAAHAARGDDVHVLHVVAAGDRELPTDGPYVLVDAETGERVPVPADAAARLARDAAGREQGWREFAARHRATYAPVAAAGSVEDAVLGWLRAGGVLA